MTNVLFDARSASLLRTTGWERYARELARRLDGNPGVTVRYGPTHQRWRLVEDWLSVPLAARGRGLVHFPSLPPGPMVRGEVLLTLHDLTWWRYPETASRGGALYYRPLARKAIERAHLVTDSDAVRDEIMDEFGVEPARITTVPLGVTPLPVPGAMSPRPRPYLLAVGTLEPRKNLARLVEAFARSGLAVDLDLLIVGRAGWGTDLPRGVTVLQGVVDADLSTLYAHAVGLVLPSVYEGFGLPLVEAMAQGTAIACSDIPVFREVTRDLALFFDPLSPDHMAQALLDLVAGAGAGSAIAAREVAQTYSWDRSASLLLEVYERLA